MTNQKIHLFQGDRSVWAIFFFLCIISLIEVYSAGSTLTYKNGSFWDPLVKQAIFLLVGTCVVVFVHNIPCRWFKIVPIFGLLATYIMLAYTTVAGAMINNAARWIPLPFGLQLQPSEIAKGVVVSTVALILATMQGENGADKRAMKFILWITVPVCGLIFFENFSTAGLLFLVVLIMMYIGRLPKRQFLLLLATVAAGAIVMLGTLKALPDNEDNVIYQTKLTKRIPTWKSRLFAKDDMKKTADPKEFRVTDDNAQKVHARIAVASCNKGIGKMPGNSVERDFLSQAYSDFIFAIIIEELGLWGAAFVVLLYVILLFRTGRIASRCERNFPAFLVMGLGVLLVTQAVLNMAVAVGLFPVTGQTLPLISRGGTSTIITCAYFGMILSVSRYARKKEDDNTANCPAEPSKDVAREFTSSEGLV